MYCANCGKNNENNQYCESCGNSSNMILTKKSSKNALKYTIIGMMFPIPAIIIIYMIGKKDENLIKYLKIGAIIASVFYIIYILTYPMLLFKNIFSNLLLS